jgi:hypothetical protein
MGGKDEEDLTTEEENKHKCEMRVKFAHNSLHTKQAMTKWFMRDKEQQYQENQQQQQEDGRQSRKMSKC